MSDKMRYDSAIMLQDELNLQLLSKLCSGEGLSINLSYLSRKLGRHRNTIRERVRELIKYKVIDRPVYPFLALFKERPVLVAVYADLPDNEKVRTWLKKDENIFAAFRIREGEYNMMLFELHESLQTYHTWRETIVKDGRIPGRSQRIPSIAIYLSNMLIEKYEPNAPIELIKQNYQEKKVTKLNSFPLDDLSLNILSRLTNGEGISVNENILAKDLGVHRRTVNDRIKKMCDAEIIWKPLCRFPSFFVPPNFILVFSLVEIRRNSEEFLKDVSSDPHVSLAYRISEGRYNLLLFEAHLSLEDYLRWESFYHSKYQECFGSIKNTYLSPNLTISIDQQKVSLGVISEKLCRARESGLNDMVTSKTYLQKRKRSKRQR
jgi:DNA-binding Lrp family transcriptional regulator